LAFEDRALYALALEPGVGRPVIELEVHGVGNESAACEAHPPAPFVPQLAAASQVDGVDAPHGQVFAVLVGLLDLGGVDAETAYHLARFIAQGQGFAVR